MPSSPSLGNLMKTVNRVRHMNQTRASEDTAVMGGGDALGNLSPCEQKARDAGEKLMAMDFGRRPFAREKGDGGVGALNPTATYVVDADDAWSTTSSIARSDSGRDARFSPPAWMAPLGGEAPVMSREVSDRIQDLHRKSRSSGGRGKGGACPANVAAVVRATETDDDHVLAYVSLGQGQLALAKIAALENEGQEKDAAGRRTVDPARLAALRFERNVMRRFPNEFLRQRYAPGFLAYYGTVFCLLRRHARALANRPDVHAQQLHQDFERILPALHPSSSSFHHGHTTGSSRSFSLDSISSVTSLMSGRSGTPGAVAFADECGAWLLMEPAPGAIPLSKWWAETNGKLERDREKRVGVLIQLVEALRVMRAHGLAHNALFPDGALICTDAKKKQKKKPAASDDGDDDGYFYFVHNDDNGQGNKDELRVLRARNDGCALKIWNWTRAFVQGMGPSPLSVQECAAAAPGQHHHDQPPAFCGGVDTFERLAELDLVRALVRLQPDLLVWDDEKAEDAVRWFEGVTSAVETEEAEDALFDFWDAHQPIWTPDVVLDRLIAREQRRDNSKPLQIQLGEVPAEAWAEGRVFVAPDVDADRHPELAAAAEHGVAAAAASSTLPSTSTDRPGTPSPDWTDDGT